MNKQKPEPIPFEPVTIGEKLTRNQKARLMYALLPTHRSRTEDELTKDFQVVIQEIELAQIFLTLINMVTEGRTIQRMEIDHAKSGQDRIAFCRDK